MESKFVIGICALDTKARSKPMTSILDRLLSTGDFEVLTFGDKVILDEDITSWPRCDFLISFFSIGFPLQKAIDYVHLTNTICLNDLHMQQLLLDRRLVLAMLDAVGVPTPKRLVTWHKDIPPLSAEVKNKADKLGVHIEKFEAMNRSVVMLDDDTIQIGDQILKKPFVEKPVSGEDHNIHIYYTKEQGGGVRKLFRKKGNKSSQFESEKSAIRCDGEQSFVYEEFMSVDNAEDVKVYTIGQGFSHAETRKSPVVDGVVRRNADGKEIRFITQLTPQEQTIARRVCSVFGQTVCGFDLLRANGRSYVIDVNGWSFVKGNQDYYDNCARIIREIFLREITKRSMVRQPQSSENKWTMKAFMSVMRHGDRTPKQKVKFIFKSAIFLHLVKDSDDEIVFKQEKQFQRVSVAVKEAIVEGMEDILALEQINNILEAKGKLQGTKVQLRPLINKTSRLVDRVQLIVKWGGLFTHAGHHQSTDLGNALRTDLNILNKDLINDIQILSSSERRVIDTAVSLCSALLSTKLDPDSILVTKEMLDDSNAAKEQTDSVKLKLQMILNPDFKMVPPMQFVMPAGMRDFSIPIQELIDLLKELRVLMNANLVKPVESNQWCCFETPFLFKERWEKLFRDFCDVERTKFESSKVSELYDGLKFDLLHNRDYLSHCFKAHDGGDRTATLWKKAKALFDIIGPHEYGIDNEEKLEIGLKNTQHLLKHLTDQLLAAQESPQPLTRLYFTKESKVYSLLNVVLLGGLKTKVVPTDIAELDYLTQLTFELYERSSGQERSVPEYSLRIAFSAGAHDPNLLELQLDDRHSLTVQQRRWLTDHIPLKEALKVLAPLDAF